MLRLHLVLAALLLATAPARAYIAVAGERLTLPEVMLEFPTVVVLEVDRSDPTRGAFLFKVRATLQGPAPESPVRHSLRLDGKLPEAFAGLKPGQLVVSFLGSPDKRSLTLAPGGWYLTTPQEGWERLANFRPDLEAVFAGTPEQLAEAARTLARGGSAVVRTRPKGGPDTGFLVRYDADFPHRRAYAAGPDGPAKEDVAGWLRAKDASRRQRALAAVAAGAAADVGDLLRLMADDNPDVRAAAACAVGAARPDAAKAVPALAALLKDEDRFVCQSAADALSPYGPAAKPAVKELLAALADRNFDHDYRPHRAAAAAEAILRISADKDATRQALRLLTSDRMLADERPDSEGTVAAAARSLARCGPAAAPALPTLGRHLTHRLPAVRAAAAEAVLRVGGSDQERATALVTLAELLEKGDTAGRCAASRSAGRCGEAASDLRPALRRLLDDPEPEVRAAAKAALDRQ